MLCIVLDHRYTTCNRDWKQCTIDVTTRCVLLEEHTLLFIVDYQCRFSGILKVSKVAYFGGSHWLAFPTEETCHIVPFGYHFYTKVCFRSCSSCVRPLVSTIHGFLGPLCA